MKHEEKGQGSCDDDKGVGEDVQDDDDYDDDDVDDDDNDRITFRRTKNRDKGAVMVTRA